jgi:hypothetical protein
MKKLWLRNKWTRITFLGTQRAGTREYLAGLFISSITAVALFTAACTSGPAPTKSAASGNPGGHIEVLCIGDRVSDPPESFHYSYKYVDSARPVDYEADITPQSMVVTIKDGSGSHSYHGMRSNEDSWNGAVLALSNPSFTAMSARLVLLNDSSAIVRRGSERMNGYDTTKYSIDTENANSSDRQKFETLIGKGSYEKGAVWVPTDGCAAKLTLDEGVAQTNSIVNKAHYEIDRIKK